MASRRSTIGQQAWKWKNMSTWSNNHQMGFQGTLDHQTSSTHNRRQWTDKGHATANHSPGEHTHSHKQRHRYHWKGRGKRKANKMFRRYQPILLKCRWIGMPNGGPLVSLCEHNPHIIASCTHRRYCSYWLFLLLLIGSVIVILSLCPSTFEPNFEHWR